jgi:hypothetical protein
MPGSSLHPYKLLIVGNRRHSVEAWPVRQSALPTQMWVCLCQPKGWYYKYRYTCLPNPGLDRILPGSSILWPPEEQGQGLPCTFLTFRSSTYSTTRGTNLSQQTITSRK